MKRMPGLPMREDVPVLGVAEKWLAGKSLLAIATEYDAAVSLIRRRLDRARKEYPDLPWTKRKPLQTPGPTQQFRQMNDGVRGEHVPRGSIVKRRAGRRPL